uniref:Uncharacterized protein n=1 Tax=Chaetoceros debilis TaxID=122233 RepID=A0A7S3V4X3_9STRA|mmetsp:Transcript_4720/g.6606  ORF Transcript_4720/g.6606 Transcript_4720/m.6606 type:complete len:170 (+) Transcript_4720:83-592(+)
MIPPFFSTLVLLIIFFHTSTCFILSQSQRSMASPIFRRSSAGKIFCHHFHSAATRGSHVSNGVYMKDASSAYWFNAGDRVSVTSSVLKAGVELQGREGEVIQTWEKCDVDPTCCCAEFVDDNYAVTVRFDGEINQESTDPNNLLQGLDTNEGGFTHFFNEDELEKVKTL